jgi:hypothetical protein
MPTDVTPAPFRNQQNFPFAIERNYSAPPAGWVSNSLPAYHSAPPMLGLPGVPTHAPLAVHNQPYLGPINRPPGIASCIAPNPPGPNSCMPNGVRNPWAPYQGETYRPAAEGAENRQMYAANMGSNGLVIPGGDGGGGGGYAGGVAGGLGGSAIAPRGKSMACGVSGSVISGSAYSGGGGGPVMGNYRLDDGWDGSQGRRHAGIAPDMTSTAGAIPRLMPSIGHHVHGDSASSSSSAGSWLHAPSSYHNHRTMIPQSRSINQAGAVYLAPPPNLGVRHQSLDGHRHVHDHLHHEGQGQAIATATGSATVSRNGSTHHRKTFGGGQPPSPRSSGSREGHGQGQGHARPRCESDAGGGSGGGTGGGMSRKESLRRSEAGTRSRSNSSSRGQGIDAATGSSDHSRARSGSLERVRSSSSRSNGCSKCNECEAR